MQLTDARNIATGREIPREHYCDQPYVSVLQDGTWLCVMTTGGGEEGSRSQHVISVRSPDQGKTWEPLVFIEPAGPPEASYVTALRVPATNRVYAFYNHNTDNRTTVIGEKNGKRYDETRVDSQGSFVFKFTDDGGRTWSPRRCRIPLRTTRIDRDNAYGGTVQFFWHVGRPLIHQGAAYVTLHKIGRFGEGFLAETEGFFLRSANLLSEPDPEKITWELLPSGDNGLRAPNNGPHAEEHSLVALENGALYCVFRTTQGYPCHAYSHDEGRSWTPPAFMTYTPGGPRVKNPRAANFVWRVSHNKYLYWFHNHSGRDYPDRNPGWLCGGVERDGQLCWSQPEIALYDDDPAIRMSYPDLVEDNGRFFLTETQKTIARVHELDPALLAALWGQFDETATVIAARGLLLDIEARGAGTAMPAPRLPALREQAGNDATVDRRVGFALDLWARWDTLEAGQIVLDTRNESGRGICLRTTDRGTLELILDDGRARSAWDSDAGALTAGRLHHLVVIVDGGPKIITFVIDGTLCDGGDTRQFGWGRFSPHLRDLNGADTLILGPPLARLRVYERALLTSEAVANYRAGRSSTSA